MNYYKLPQTLDKEFTDFKQTIKDFKDGKLDALTFKTIRVPFGVYEQRTLDTYMVRIRLASGLVSASQLNKLCDLSTQYADGKLHITTRGDVQLHNVLLDSVEHIVAGIHSVGISSRGGGGNTLRNITADVYSKNYDSVFDVSVHGSVLTTKLLEYKDSFALPRKYKIVFSSSAADRANATITDVGFIAKIKDNKRGFSVWTAGGMGAKSRLGQLMYDFVPEEEIFIISEAVKKVFDTHGNRKKKHANRLRFLVSELGFEEYMRLVEEQTAILKADKNNYLHFEDSWFANNEPVVNTNEPNVDEKGFLKFLDRFVKVQNNELYAVKIPLVLGDISANGLKDLISTISPLGENNFRFGIDQNMYIYDIHKSWLKLIFEKTQNLSRLTKLPLVFGDIIACAGAATCQLGIGLSRGASEAIEKKLLASNLDLDIFQGLKIHISGCPNSCGKHAVADIGFYGKAGRFEERLYPAYVVQIGAKIAENESEFAKTMGEVPAFQVPNLVNAILNEVPAKFANNFYEWAKQDEDSIKAIVARFNNIPSFADDKNPYYDFGATEVFSLKDRGSGECSAGMFDLIESDQKRAKTLIGELAKEQKQELKDELVLVSARMLLVARGEEAREAKGVFEAFKRQFVESGLVDAKFGVVVQKYLDNQANDVSFNDANDLAEAVNYLYSRMDHTLKFAVEPKAVTEEKKEEPKQNSAVEEHDFRGVACPMNFVKTKMALSKKSSGDAIEILLDSGAPIDNVPKSVQSEGHKVTDITQEGAHWRVRIIKK